MAKTKLSTWFPLRTDMMEGEEWAALTVAEKALFLTMNRDDNQKPPGWYKADMEFAVEVKLSEIKVRKARRKFQTLGIVDVVPGFRSRGKTVATTYKAVKWSKAPTKPEKVFFAHMGRYFWEVLLECVRDGRFSHADIVTMAGLTYLHARRPRRLKDESLVANIAKSERRRVAGLENVQEHIENLYNGFKYSGGAHLFDYRITHTHVRLSDLNFCDEDNNADLDKKRREGLKSTIAVKRESAKRERLAREYESIVARHAPILDAKLTAYIEHGLEPDISRIPLEAIQAKVIQLRGKDRWKTIGPTAKNDKTWLLRKHVLPCLEREKSECANPA
jgi:hypothetical protein